MSFGGERGAFSAHALELSVLQPCDVYGEEGNQRMVKEVSLDDDNVVVLFEVIGDEGPTGSFGVEVVERGSERGITFWGNDNLNGTHSIFDAAVESGLDGADKAYRKLHGLPLEGPVD